MNELSLGLTSLGFKFFSVNHGMSIPITLGLTTRVEEWCKVPLCVKRSCVIFLRQEVKDNTAST